MTETAQSRLSENVKAIRESIAIAAQKSGRNPEDVLLCAVSKTHSIEAVKAMSQLDVDMFGESRVQEMTAKLAEGAFGKKPVHFIGHLQTNKVKNVVGTVDLIQSVDSERLLCAISEAAIKKGIVQDVLIEINIGAEQSKGGIEPERFDHLLGIASEQKGVFVRGIMAIPPILLKTGGNDNFFYTLFQMFIDTKGKKYDNIAMDFLSMGMSSDFCDAISAGANLVRVGSALFGARDYK